MKNFNDETKLKNVIVPVDTTKNKVRDFISNFTTLKKSGKGFFLTDDLRADYVALKGIATQKGIKNIPTEEELDEVLQ